MATQFTNADETIDTRDVLERIAELELEAQGRFMEENEKDGEGTSYGELASAELSDWLDEEDGEELKLLVALIEEVRNTSDERPEDGVTLIRETYFDGDYAENYADELGFFPEGVNKSAWPFSLIDWDEAADELKEDYTDVDFDGVTYLVL